jgi:rubredoxin
VIKCKKCGKIVDKGKGSAAKGLYPNTLWVVCSECLYELYEENYGEAI